MVLLTASFIGKITIFLVAVIFPVLTMALDFNQTQRLTNQANAVSKSNLDMMYYNAPSARTDYIKSVELYQKSADQDDAKIHTVLAINITIAKLCVKIMSKQVSCLTK